MTAAESIILDLINSDIVFSIVIWALFFNVFYLGLKLTNFFKQKNLNFVVALIVSILAITPRYLGFGFDVVEVISRFLPNLGVLIIITIFTILLAGLFGQDKDFFLKNGHMIFGLVFIITANMVVFYSLPGIFTQFLSISLLMAILSSMDKQLGMVAYLPTTFIVVFFALLYWAIIDETSLPDGIMWIGYPIIYNTLLAVLAFAIIIKFVLKD